MSQSTSWKSILGDRRELLISVLTVIVLVVTLTSYASFLTGIEMRQGFAFTDPVHQLVGPVDVTWPIFLILYGSLITAVGLLLGQPLILFRALRAYTILVAIRMLCMWMLPLDPPTTMIALSDPIVELFTTNGASTLTRDLFFSGHTATFFLIGAVVPNKLFRRIYYGLGTVVAVLVLVQHVHYTVDVLVAPMAAFTAAYLVGGFARHQ